MWWSILGGVEAFWVLALSGYIVLQRRTPISTVAWILTLAFMPLVGLPLYVFFGPQRLTRKRLRYERGRKALADTLSELPRGSLGEDVTQLMELGVRAGRAPVRTATSVTSYRTGRETYAAIEEAIRAATHHVHVEYYIFERDRQGTRLRDLLIDKARAGVQVRVVYDALGCGGVLRSWAFFKPVREAGGQVFAFNPPRFALRFTSLLNFRTHRKIVVCDGKVGFTGGINVSECHTEEYSEDRAWRDTHVRIEGEAVRGLQQTFLENWYFAAGSAPREPEYFPELEAGSELVQILRSGPDDPHFAIHAFYFAAIANADQRVLLTTPYLVPDEAMLTALKTAVQRGVDVRILVPEHGDSALVTSCARSYYDELCTAGVKLYEYMPRMLHAKTLVIDRDLALVGTANFDNRSFKLNFEVAAVLYGAPHADAYAKAFHDDCESARRVKGRFLHDLPLSRRFFESAARLMSPIL